VIQNDLCEPLPVRLRVGDAVVAPTLPADSFSTLLVKTRAGPEAARAPRLG
jgi:glucosylceramidase